MMYDFKKWQYNSAEKHAVMEEAMKADAGPMLGRCCMITTHCHHVLGIFTYTNLTESRS